MDKTCRTVIVTHVIITITNYYY